MLGLVQVPSTSEAVDAKGVYTVFDVHLNGNYHGSVRYSQLLAFHQELKSKYDLKSVEEFPGKHWFSSLSSEQLFARRVGIERYLHSLAQDKMVGQSSDLKEFFIALQRVSCDLQEDGGDTEMPLDVFLVNGKSITLQVNPFQRSDEVLEGVASHVQLGPQLTYYFNLYIERQEGEEQTWTVVRPLTEFECPHITLQTLNKTAAHRVTIRKSFWDKAFLAEILADRVGKNLLYIECLAAVTAGHWEIPSHTRSKLTTFQKKSQKKEYVELVGSLPQYGFVQLDGFVLDHPEELYTVSVRVGKLEMVTYVHAASSTTAGASQNGSSAELKVVESYPLTKIRSWKVGDKWNTPSPSWKAPWLKFFLQTEDDFLPITMQGPHAIFLSNCLHAIVNELLRIRGGQDIRRPTGTAIDRKLYELPRLVFYESAEILQDRREGKHIKVQEEETDAAPDSTSDTPTSTSSGVPTNTTDTSTTPTSTTPISDTCTTSTQDPSSVSNATPSTKTTPSIKSTPTTSPTAEAKPLPSESTTIKPAKRSSSSDHPALLTKVKDNVMAMIKRESTTPSDAENITFDFGTDDDL